MDAIVYATKRNAELLELQDQIGTVEAGKRADLILVDGNPLDDISILQDQSRISLVMRDGCIHKRLWHKLPDWSKPAEVLTLETGIIAMLSEKFGSFAVTETASI